MDKYKYQNKWRKKHTKRIMLTFYDKRDAEVIEYFKSVSERGDSVTGEVMRLFMLGFETEKEYQNRTPNAPAETL